MKESLNPTRYIDPILETFCDSLIREQDKLIHLGIINNANTSEKSLLSQQKEKSKPPKKHNFAIISQTTRVSNPLSQPLL